MQTDILIYTNFQSYKVVVKNGTSFPMSIQWQLVPYTKYGNSYTKYGKSCPIQNMATCAVYKKWQLMPKCHIMASVHRRVSQSSFPHLELPGAPPKSIFLFFEIEESRFLWPLWPPPLGLWNDNNQMSTPTVNYTSIKHNLKIKISFQILNSSPEMRP